MRKYVILAITALFLIFSILSCKSGIEPETEKQESQSGGQNTGNETHPSSAAAEEQKPAVNPDFRNLAWYMTKSEVKKSEEGKFFDEDDKTIAFTDSVLGESAELLYEFNDSEQLIGGFVVFRISHVNDNDYIDDYDDIKESLSAKYGAPDQDDVIWKNSLFKDDPEDYGLAISCGHLAYMASWSTETTKITLLLCGDNYEISLVILYRPLNYTVQTDTTGI